MPINIWELRKNEETAALKLCERLFEITGDSFHKKEIEYRRLHLKLIQVFSESDGPYSEATPAYPSRR